MGLAQRSREVEAERQNKGREVGAGGNAAREGGRDAWADRGARSVDVVIVGLVWLVLSGR